MNLSTSHAILMYKHFQSDLFCKFIIDFFFYLNYVLFFLLKYLTCILFLNSIYLVIFKGELNPNMHNPFPRTRVAKGLGYLSLGQVPSIRKCPNCRLIIVLFPILKKALQIVS